MGFNSKFTSTQFEEILENAVGSRPYGDGENVEIPPSTGGSYDDSGLRELINQKANSADVYTKAEVDAIVDNLRLILAELKMN